MAVRDQFLKEYQDQVLDALVLPPCLSAQYNVLSCLKDGERQVYLIQDQVGWPAILKVQSIGREDALKQEYDLLHRLRHPQIPQPVFYLEWEEKEYLIREYVKGISLYEQVIAQGTLSTTQVRSVVLSLCQVLNYLHCQQPPVICRDVKPQNVILDPSGNCHLIDLGAARRYRPEQREDTVFLGTQITAPPEQFGYQQTDQRSDLYSLGILMRFLLTGSFDSSTQGIGHGYLDRIIRRCTAFDPKNRYASVRTVYRILKYHCLRLSALAAASVICIAIVFSFLWGSIHETRPRSSLLEAALRQELHLDDGAPIPKDRLGEVEQLLICGQTLIGTLQEHENQMGYTHDHYAVEMIHGNITDDDLELLAACTNLRILVMDYQQITDLSPLINLPLEYLSLTGNQISDLSPLAGQTKLQILDLGENPIRSTEVLAELNALDEVTLDATGITSVDVFAGSSIQSLNVRSTWVTDFSSLASCPNLTRLVVGNLPDGTVETLTGLTNLMELRLYSTQGVDLSQFIGFQNLQALDLYSCTISHPEALTLLPNLRYLNLGDTGINDLSFLPEMPTITDVDLRNNPLTDLSPLLDCSWLSLLILSNQHQPLVQKQLPQTSFQIQYQ